MTKLHELLARKGTLDTETESLVKSHRKSFSTGVHIFQGHKRIFFPKNVEEGKEDSVVEEERELVTTVVDEMKFLFDRIIPTVDVNVSVDLGNTEAFADIIIDGQVIASRLPATSLMYLEKRINQIIDIIKDIHTCDPVLGFRKDDSGKPHVLRAPAVRRRRTAKIEDYKVIVQATDKHPAQVVKVTEDTHIGDFEVHNVSGLPTTMQKSNLLSRAYAMKNAIAEARMRANCHEVEQKSIFKPIAEYIMEGFNS